MKKFLKWAAIILVAIVILSIIFGGDDNKPETTVSTDTATSAEVVEPEVEAASAPEGDQRADSMTRQQKNAVRSAEQYLAIMGFSRDGLIKQLSSDVGGGYSVEDATIAVDSLNVNWNEQAVKTAKQYLDTQGFSCNALIKQLSSSVGSQFTQEQAEHGAKQAGACD